jgi:hypothetical protein
VNEIGWEPLLSKTGGFGLQVTTGHRPVPQGVIHALEELRRVLQDHHMTTAWQFTQKPTPCSTATDPT